MKIIKYLSTLALLFVAFVNQPAQALLNSKINNTYAVTSASWGTQIATQTGPGSSGSYQITWTGNKNNQNALFSIVNTGNTNLITSHISFSSAKPNGDTTNPPNLIFHICNGIWDPNTFACSGNTSQVGSAFSGNIDFTNYVPSGGRFVVLVNNARNSNSNWITTINTQVTRSDIRAAYIINS